MADVTENQGGGNKRSLHKSQPRKQVRVDLTPMVDLAFLLISFFMLSTVMGKPRAMELNQPKSGEPIDVADCQVLNILIDKNDKVYSYDGLNVQDMQCTSFNGNDGIRQVILSKARNIKAECGNYTSGKPREIICLIKLLPGASYKSMVDILDEMDITSTKTYTLQDPLDEEIRQVGEKQLLAEN